VAQFSRKVRDIIDQDGRLAWARNFFWGLEIRGVKDITSHDVPCTGWDHSVALTKVLDLVDTREGTWYVDIGLTFMIHGQALLWTRDGHAQLLSHLLYITIDEANVVIGNPLCYSGDITTHVMALSGFRADMSKSASPDGMGPFSIAYVQAYQTDKQQTYHPEGSRFGKTITAKVAVKGNPPLWCQSLLDVYHDGARGVDAGTRVEVRVPLAFSVHALRDFTLEGLKRTMVCYKRELWW
jgi:hypothetical protein